MNSIGKRLILTSYGESHGARIGGVLDGFPSGYTLDKEYIQAQLDRRKPGQSALSTERKESDVVFIDSGVFDGKTTGAPIHFYLNNDDARPADYDKLKEVYRPSHADFSYEKRYGYRDHRGGGRSSARITAAWVAAGALAQHYLESKGIKIGAYVQALGVHELKAPPTFYSREQVDASAVRCPDVELANAMMQSIKKAKEEGDSLGGSIQCVISGLEAGIGNPVFDKLNAKLAHYLFSINAVKGVEIGGGFAMSKLKGSEVNDAFVKSEKGITTSSNFSGGIQGGISNGMDIHARIAFKPTATIGKEQQTVNQAGESTTLEAKGRHDPSVLPRAVPIVEAMSALCILDALL